MIGINTILQIHDLLINEFGGSKGLRDRGGLEAAISRPYATFDSKDLYPEPINKAAAIFESLIINHPFIDGNKRTAYVLLRLTLLQFGHDINASESEKYQMTISASKGEIKFAEIKIWLSEKLIK